jgi:plastocyanin
VNGMRSSFALLLLALVACTPGGASISGGGGGGGNVTTIDVNLTLSQPVNTQYGQSGGMTPPVTTVAVGSMIQFTNTDGFAHTATLIPPSDKTFPAGSPFSTSATTQHGTSISTPNWTSGAMQAGTSSQLITVDKPGTYLFGCFFHYGAPMRGAIVAQ